ncbi:MAG: diguanylate cyclase [gamma proteobacterium symbiont of Bathyaustriella thionipta]|nr:diguanylate cyclase [gamma proteobacterium symbiont of Bathyaustriella thionipta]MCU7950807.1 diguanylate cyclase [gamma proteobacterium symbiont of Bathyaustriella thionipta]MCU7953750.1 diguanylate cyclase [gamma proteobacterium symbiont of Bathyaustriella thionipta]MCU7957319.1 diguanylate cyclase [gamma proteobacterium symbiont of Bathyaustriella thionipta]MCU7967930.1 diguanylate cyclase [gamma proteobacterium symbiont of Bathyaustriella thionipta]
MNIAKRVESEFSIKLHCSITVYFAVVFLLLSNLSLAAVTITESTSKIDDFTMGYLYDADSIKNIEAISQSTFTEEISSQFALGYRTGAAWFKLTLHNESDEGQFILSFTEPFWTTLDLYDFNDNHWQVSKNGLKVPLNERNIEEAMPTFSIDIRPGQTKDFYVRGTTVSSHIGEFQLFSPKEYYRISRTTISKTYNLYSGVLLFIMLLTGFLFFVMRERIYLYYISYVLSFLIWVNVQNGHYLYMGIPGWNDALHAIGTLVVFFLVLFTNELLDLKRNSPFVGQLFRLSAIIILICGILISLEIPHVSLFFNIYSSLFFILLLITSIRAWIHDYFISARYYLIALVIYMPTMALMTMTYNGLIPNIDLTRYAFTVGSLIEIIFFSFILVSYYYDTRKKKIQIQQELLFEREQKAELLECEVEKRTIELHHINEQLRHQTIELQKSKKRLTIEASTDSLTTLYNRRYFMQMAIPLFKESKRNKQVMSLLMIDIDRFKGINDNFSHDAGDEAIKACSEIFKTSARDSDIIARYGGEEFIILMPQSTKDEAVALAERIRSYVEKHQMVLGKENISDLKCWRNRNTFQPG